MPSVNGEETVLLERRHNDDGLLADAGGKDERGNG
jgi:hypothetical protein